MRRSAISAVLIAGLALHGCGSDVVLPARPMLVAPLETADVRAGWMPLREDQPLHPRPYADRDGFVALYFHPASAGGPLTVRLTGPGTDAECVSADARSPLMFNDSLSGRGRAEQLRLGFFPNRSPLASSACVVDDRFIAGTYVLEVSLAGGTATRTRFRIGGASGSGPEI